MNNYSLKLNQIKLILFDLEGVLLKNFKSSDENQLNTIKSALREFGTKMKQKGIITGIVTADNDKKIINFFEKIKNIELKNGTIDKVKSAEKILKKFNLQFADTAYVGDGILDLPLLQKTKLAFVPASADRTVKRSADFIITAPLGAPLLNEIINLFESV